MYTLQSTFTFNRSLQKGESDEIRNIPQKTIHRKWNANIR